MSSRTLLLARRAGRLRHPLARDGPFDRGTLEGVSWHPEAGGPKRPQEEGPSG